MISFGYDFAHQLKSLIAFIYGAIICCSAQQTIAAPNRGPEVDKNLFVSTLTKTVVEGEKMTTSEVMAMEPACLVIGMGRATGKHWGMPEGTYNNHAKPKYSDYPMLSTTEGSGNAQWFHHYCWAELNRLRYNSALNLTKKRFYLSKWESAINYVLQDAEGKGWPYSNKALGDLSAIQLASGKPALAINTALKVLAADIDMLDVHLTLADSYIALNKKTEAKESLTEAIKLFGATKMLTRRYKSLTGMLPDPSLLQTSKASKTEPSLPVEIPVSTNEKSLSIPPKAADTATKDKVSSPVVPAPPPLPTEKPPSTSLPSNPYCRFCP